ncbi:MAG TPA: DNA polymerase III subunit beta [Thermoanaerobaculia bacterium]|nr:DNA polymerase III subunit beta [Thermoanaerobaculia bacterium]HUM28678.1 DNA polymerase III subunit beta [Thermoanaerobaculia bacterium]HXK66714.1 DNA polymerase III subunit beta [Thermoanaerobaculia bacterium]
MRLNVSREHLSRELSVAQNIVEKKATIAILTNVLLNVTKNDIHLTATDLDITYQSRVPVEVEEEGSVTVLASKVSEIFRLIPDKEVRVFMTEHDRLRVEGDSLFYELPTQSPEDFPKVPDVEDFGGMTVDHRLLRTAFEKVLPSIAQDEYKYQYGAILAKTNESELELVSIDGYRMNFVTLPVRVDTGVTFPDILITRKAAQEIVKIEDEKEVRLVQHDKFIAFLYGARKMTCRQPQVNFPDYSGFLENRGSKVFVFDREEMAEAIKRVSIVSAGNYKGIKFILENGKLTLDGSHPDYGEAVETLSVDYEGSPVTIIFNARYVQDFLSTVHVERVHVYFTDPEKKVFFVPDGEEDISHSSILMPITL